MGIVDPQTLRCATRLRPTNPSVMFTNNMAAHSNYNESLMSKRTKWVVLAYGAWVLIWSCIATYGAFFKNHGEYGVGSHLWLTITGLPSSLLSWFIAPHGTLIGTIVAGLIGLIQWGVIVEGYVRWGSQKSETHNT